MKIPTQHLLAAAVLAALGSTAVSAQTPADAKNLDTVIVTGTRAPDRTALESASPIDILSKQDLAKAGVLNGELGQALQVLLPSLNFPRQSNATGADHVRSAQLRGLSPDQVLVLVNGKRRHTSAIVNLEAKTGKGTNPVDFNSIPVSAIARIEVLRDGAGAQYGSDAIAGVINVILDDNPEGASASIAYGAHRTDFDPTGDTLIDGQTTTASASLGNKIGEDGFIRFGVEYKDRNATNRAGLDQLPFFENQSPENLATIGQRNYHPGDPDTQDINLWLNTAVAVGDATEWYAFATYNQRDSVGAAFFRYPDSSANVPSVYPDGYRPETLGDNRDLSLSSGLRGDIGDWNYDASLTWGENRFDLGLRNSLNPSLGSASPTAFDLAGYQFEQLTANVDINRLVSISGKDFTFATGAEYRHEGYVTRAGDPASYAAGPNTGSPPGAQAGPGLAPADAVDLSRSVFGAYAELSGDLSERFFGTAALRYEDYSDFGGQLTGKLAGRFQINDTVALRGAVSTNFRAPSLSQTGYRFTVTNFGDGGALTQVRLLAVDDPIAVALGARDLKPETSRNVSFGITAQPTTGLNISLDAFQIDVDDRVTISERIGGPALVNFLDSQFGITDIESVNFFTNAVDTRTRGAELVANYSTEAWGGNLNLTGAYSYAKTDIRAIQATPPQLLALDPDYVLVGVEERNTLTTAAPRTRAILSAQWQGDAWSWLGRATRHGSATRVFNFGGGFEPQQTYGAEWQLDAEAAYRFNAAVAVAVGASNLLDNYPDASSADINYFGNFPYDFLSPIGMNGAYYYARIDFTF
ncbi:TonB-dependent receptor [Arenimonas sp. GDDSR-1]|uniref:TonB-dependent receptor plug domain-containing protein n=1 Tax=Arenimonas sp. GDDSR-1 TaxID=2950125 RepID=UPI00261D6E5B|nr:TonB-dependent receptor [Arenimonas sp. GDDSR-1]